MKALTGTKPKSERAAFKAVASLESTPLRPCCPLPRGAGATITAKKALKANGAKLTTAQGGTIKVKVRHSTITLKDEGP